MIQTKITKMFNIKYPIICGAMMWICKEKMCAAISEAGGMGNLTAGNYDTEEKFREAIRTTKKLTEKPFMVNVTILPSLRITNEHHKMYLKVCAEEKVAGIEVSGAPIDKACGMEYIVSLKEAGVKLFHKVGGLDKIIPLISGERCQNAWATGDVSAAPMMVGQSIGMIHDVPTCAELLENMMTQALERLKKINNQIKKA